MGGKREDYITWDEYFMAVARLRIRTARWDLVL